MSLKPEVTKEDHMQGNANAPIELVEYGDYECPYCGEAYGYMKKIKKKFGNDLKFVFRNFPLYNVHPHAMHAAIAAEVAGDHGKFWQMHDILYENQNYLADKNLLGYAEQLGIDAGQFEAAFSDSKYVEKVESDLESGLRSGVNGTPSFFVNGQKYNGDYRSEDFLELLKSMID